MKSLVPFCCLLALPALSPLRAGTITGIVRAEGKPGLDAEAAGGNYDSHKFRFAERVNYAELSGMVVYLEGPIGWTSSPAPRTLTVDTRRVSQKGAMFTPHILPVMAGTSVEWPNHDEIYHNVFSMSETKPFDLDLYKGNPPGKKVLFDKAGRVDVYCSIHANMHCIVLVLTNPFFAMADDHGRYAITNVPAGSYRIKAWHERLPAQVKEVAVPGSGEVRVDFLLGIRGLPKY